MPAANDQPKPESWETILGIPKPASCNLMAACCSVAVPSIPVDELFEQAAQGNETCRDFLSVFIPHLSHEAAKDFYPEQPEYIDRILARVATQSTKAQLEPESVVFYHCRYLNEERHCTVYEDRPQFCRDFPSSPMNILVKGCGYQGWVDACKEKLRQLGYEVVDPVEGG